MTAYIFDAAIVVILAFFAWRGAKKGLILTLCEFSGQVIMITLRPPVKAALLYQPVLYHHLIAIMAIHWISRHMMAMQSSHIQQSSQEVMWICILLRFRQRSLILHRM